MERTCYLVRDGKGVWHICYPGAINIKKGSEGAQDGIRLAWFDRDSNGLVVFDHDEPEVKDLPE